MCGRQHKITRIVLERMAHQYDETRQYKIQTYYMKLLALHSVNIVEAKSIEQCRRDNEERKKTNPLVIATNNENKLVLDILN